MEKDRLLIVGNLAKDVVYGEEIFGGCAASISVNARRLGCDLGIMSVLGRDDFSKRYRDYLASLGIDFSLVSDHLKELPVCEVVSSTNSIRSSIWHDNDCHPAMDALEVDEQQVCNFALVHLVSCPPALARRISEWNTPISYEPGPMLIEDPGYLDPFVLTRSRILFLNQEEYDVALQITGFNGPKDFIINSDRVMVVTKGSEGSNIYQMRHEILATVHVDPFPLRGGIVDSTGAGDCYKAGFLTSYVKGRSLQECGRIGSEMGSLGVSQNGGILRDECIGAIRSKYQLDEFRLKASRI